MKVLEDFAFVDWPYNERLGTFQEFFELAVKQVHVDLGVGFVIVFVGESSQPRKGLGVEFLSHNPCVFTSHLLSRETREVKHDLIHLGQSSDIVIVVVNHGSIVIWIDREVYFDPGVFRVGFFSFIQQAIQSA